VAKQALQMESTVPFEFLRWANRLFAWMVIRAEDYNKYSPSSVACPTETSLSQVLLPNEVCDSIAIVNEANFFSCFHPKNRMSSPRAAQPKTNQQHPLGV
jgi:hypothetical protein